MLVPPDDVDALRHTLGVLLGTSAAGRRELGAAGLFFARSHFDMARHLPLLDQLYASPCRALGVSCDTRNDTDARDDAPGAVRIYLGCNTDQRAGWINIDSRAEVSPTIVTRAHRLDMFADGSVDTIEACHLLELLPFHEAQSAFAEWARVLRPGGELLLELPDVEACVRILGQSSDDHGHDIGMVGLFGWPPGIKAHGDDWAHHSGWSPRSLGRALESRGFGHIEVLPVTQTWRPAARLGRDFRIRAVRSSAVEAAA
jgi:SAM-dependent methyltransferase